MGLAPPRGREVTVPASHRAPRGFTIIELAVVVAIAAAILALGYPLLSRTRPRAQLAGLGTELQAVMHRARQEALAQGRDVAVIFYPSATTSTGQGRILVVVDGASGYMAGAAPAGNLDYCTTTPALTPEVLAQIDLPTGLTFATPPRTVALPFPYNLVSAPTNGCSFCNGTVPGGGARGAVRFDSRGRASLFADCGAPLSAPSGGSVAVTSTELGGSRVVAVLPSGGIRTFTVE
jgi:prepilin-type N-terminal cleavage/methylation domain-containing protein